jgi:hypothetical protein
MTTRLKKKSLSEANSSIFEEFPQSSSMDECCTNKNVVVVENITMCKSCSTVLDVNRETGANNSLRAHEDKYTPQLAFAVAVTRGKSKGVRAKELSQVPTYEKQFSIVVSQVKELFKSLLCTDEIEMFKYLYFISACDNYKP